MKTMWIQFENISMGKTYSTWAQACDIAEQHLKMAYPELKDWEIENIMLQLEEKPVIFYKDFYVDLSQRVNRPLFVTKL